MAVNGARLGQSLPKQSPGRLFAAQQRSRNCNLRLGLDRGGTASGPFYVRCHDAGCRATLPRSSLVLTGLNHGDSKRFMMRSSSETRSSIRIHASLDFDDHQRLAALAEREHSSVARIVKLAVIDFLDRHAPIGPEYVGDVRSSKQTRQGTP